MYISCHVFRNGTVAFLNAFAVWWGTLKDQDSTGALQYVLKKNSDTNEPRAVLGIISRMVRSGLWIAFGFFSNPFGNGNAGKTSNPEKDARNYNKNGDLKIHLKPVGLAKYRQAACKD